MRLKLILLGRTIEFDMDFDASFHADVATKYFIDQSGCCEPELVHLMFRVLNEGDVAIDAGANIGFFTLVMAKLVGPSGRVLAFEPAPNNIAKLKFNLAINRIENVTIIEYPLWHTAGRTVTLYMFPDSGLSSLANAPDRVAEISLLSTTLFEHTRDCAPKLLKLDVEGAEQRVLEGFGKTAPYVTCELNPDAMQRFDTDSSKLLAYMRPLYDPFVLHADGTLPALLPASTSVNSARNNKNLLFSTVENVGKAWPEIWI